jgi:8-hydroxy-5-deazaflavin:NADPH oxidoreductase
MKIGVIGAGKIGGTIGGKWEAAGHEVAYGLRDPSKRKGAKTIDQALSGAEVVLLAVPGAAVSQFVHDHAKGLDGKVVVDATNNFGAKSFHSWSELASTAPSAKLYRAFNSLGWDVFANPVLGGQQADLFYAGAEGASKQVVEKLISDAGLRPIWVGGPDQVDTVDGLLRLWSTLSGKRGRRIAFKLISD